MTRGERILVGTYPTAQTSEPTNMAQVKVNVDLDPALVERLDQYIEVLAADPKITALHPGKVTRSTVLRHVMAEGLAALDERYEKRSSDCGQSKKRGNPKAKQ